MKLTKSILAAAFAFTAVTNAQETKKFSLSGEFRPRSEYFGNGGNYTGGSFPAKTATNADEGFVRTSVRAAINAKYTTDSYTTYIGIQEVFAFGDRQQISDAASQNAAGASTFRVQEAWADIKLGDYSSLKIGRQTLSYDDQRILGGLGWAQQARTHDGLVFKYKKDGYSLDLGGALNTTTDDVYKNSTFFTYRDMGFVHANKKYDALNVSALALVNTFQDGRVDGGIKATLLTAGLHADYKVGIVGLAANIYIQEGQRLAPPTGAALDVSGAYLASLDAKIKASDKITVLAGGEIISGRQDNGDAAFFPVYGTNHKFNGFMDRFYVGNNGNAGGLVDLNLGLKTKIKGYAITLKGHYFLEDEDVAGAPGVNTGAVGFDGKELGSELDLVVAKKFNGFKLVGGYSQFFEPSGVADLATTKGTQNWAWLMLIIKPKFL